MIKNKSYFFIDTDLTNLFINEENQEIRKCSQPDDKSEKETQTNNKLINSSPRILKRKIHSLRSS